MEENVAIYGLIGYPVKHSFSPAMHNAAFNAMKKNARYVLFELSPQKLEIFLTKSNSKISDVDGNEFLAKEVKGFNVTVPYKEKVLDFIEVDDCSRHLKTIKAVNTIVRTGASFKGFNTDISGFSTDLNVKVDISGQDVAVLGAGGAARAVVFSLAQKAASVTIFDIDNSKSRSVCAMVKTLLPSFNIVAVETLDDLKLADKKLLVNVTPVGMREGDPSPIGKNSMHKNLFIYDIVYNRETQLLRDAKDLGLCCAGGLGMLLYQGVLAWEKWTGQPAPVEIMRDALRKELSNVRA